MVSIMATERTIAMILFFIVFSSFSFRFFQPLRGVDEKSYCASAVSSWISSSSTLRNTASCPVRR